MKRTLILVLVGFLGLLAFYLLVVRQPMSNPTSEVKRIQSFSIRSEPSPDRPIFQNARGNIMATTLPVRHHPSVVNAGGTALALAFEGDSIDPDLASVVVSDLNLILGHLKNSEFVRAPETSPSAIISGRPYPVVSSINYIGKGRFIPDSIESFLGGIVEVEGQRKLLIGKEMAALYREAKESSKQHPEVFDSLPAFINKLNKLAEAPPSDSKELVFLGNLSADELKSIEGFTAQQFVDSFGNKSYRAPSLLEVQPAFGIKGTDATSWFAPLFVIEKDGISDAAPTAIYQSGHWKLLLSSSSL